MTAPLRIDDLTVRYGEITALDGASLTVRPGAVTGLIGMNGSGKSTLFRAVMGELTAQSGTVTIAGRSPREARRAGIVSFMPQSETIDWSFPVSVADVVMMGRYGRLGIARRPGATDRAAVADALERVGLSELAERQIGRLSGGQRKRAFLARAIAQDAELLLLDEPFAGVDQASESLIVELLRTLANGGRTVLVSTHDLGALPRLADDAALLRQRVLFHGPAAEALRPERLAAAFGLTSDSGRHDEGSRS